MEEIHLAHDRKGIGSPSVHHHSRSRATQPFDPVSANGSTRHYERFTAFGRLRAHAFRPRDFPGTFPVPRARGWDRGLSTHELSATPPTTNMAARCWHGGSYPTTIAFPSSSIAAPHRLPGGLRCRLSAAARFQSVPVTCRLSLMGRGRGGASPGRDRQPRISRTLGRGRKPQRSGCA